MMRITTPDAVQLHVEEAGSGTPILFIHEFGGNHESWEPQVRRFSRRHRCIVYAARGYPPSDVPDDPDAYSQDHAVADAVAVLDGLQIARAHIVGLSMGGFATVHFGLRHPDRALSLLASGVGYGSDPADRDAFQAASRANADAFEREGAAAFGPIYADTASRRPFRDKDPRGWAEFLARIGRHSSRGAANTQRGYQARRPSLYAFEAELRAMAVPTLIVAGDADELSLLPSLFLRRSIPACGLAVLPRTGHAINLEEPDLFNAHMSEFIAQVEAGAWLPSR